MSNYDEAAISKAVKVAVGLNQKAVKKGQHHTGFQILLTLSRKAVKTEDGLLREKDSTTGDNAALVELLQWQELGMEDWWSLYPRRAKPKAPKKRGERILSLEPNDDLELPRQALDVAFYTNNLDEATKRLNVFDGSHSGWRPRVSKQDWTRASVGWNKKGKSIVVVLDTISILNLAQMNRFSFGPLMTAFLIAMAPKAKNRLLVIRYCIGMLLSFYAAEGEKRESRLEGIGFAPPEFTSGDPKRIALMQEWYALHTLCRLFRMRFGCDMFQHQTKVNGYVEWVETKQPAGSLQDYDLSKDRRWLTYKKTIKPELKRFLKSADK